MSNKYSTVSVIGLGYIGLPTAALLASEGYRVNGIDVNKKVVDIINSGKIHIVEPDLLTYVSSAVNKNKLRAYLEVQPADVYIICVPTPFSNDSEVPTPNLKHVTAAAENIAPHLKDNDIVILESTSPVGTTALIQKVLKKNRVDFPKVHFAYCPERVLPGNIMTELVENARVIGGLDFASTRVIADFYRTFVNGEILETQAKTAEMCKLAENSFRDVNIAFANELSVICDRNGVNVWDLIDLANHHPRVNVLKPSTGVGGHCIAVDPWFIVSSDPKNSRLIRTARNVNDEKPEWVVNKIKAVADSKKIKKIACLGLAFKSDIDDLRESPAVKVVELLLENEFEVCCVEPNIRSHPKYNLVDIKYAISECDLIVLLVSHKEFMAKFIREKLAGKCIIDFCGAIER